MRDRDKRLKAIQKLIQDQDISSQEVFLGLLNQEGFALTQATLSRDLKVLGVVKRRGSDGGYVYSLPEGNPLKENLAAYRSDFIRGFLSVDISGNLAVIRTIAGHANAVAVSLDQMDLDTILGCVAGDDTIMVALRAEVKEEAFLADLEESYPGLEVQ